MFLLIEESNRDQRLYETPDFNCVRHIINVDGIDDACPGHWKVRLRLERTENKTYHFRKLGLKDK